MKTYIGLYENFTLCACVCEILNKWESFSHGLEKLFAYSIKYMKYAGWGKNECVD